MPEQPRRYRKRPLEIEALRFDGSNADQILEWAAGFPTRPSMWVQKTILGGEQVVIRTLEGQVAASLGVWVIRGVVGEVYPCAPDVFDLTYEAVDA